jgi:hypothetical protein
MRNVPTIPPARQLRWPLVTLAVVVVSLLVPAAGEGATCGGPCFTAGPSVRVTSSSLPGLTAQVEFKWRRMDVVSAPAARYRRHLQKVM